MGTSTSLVLKLYNIHVLKNSKLLLVIIFVIIFGSILWYGSQKNSKPVAHNPVENTPQVSPTSEYVSPTLIPSKSWSDLNYISTVDWPPAVTIKNGSYTCTQAGDENARAGRTEERTIDGQKYCVTVVTEGAAGSIYNQYAYLTEAGNNQLKISTFSIRLVQCGNYPEPKMTECQNERDSFNVDEYVIKDLQGLNK
jgi:hypothetical protein